MSKRKFWWNCQYMKSQGVPYCTKYDNLCLRSKCDEMDDTKGKLQKELQE